MGTAFAGFPDTKKTDKEVVAEAGVHRLADEEDVRAEGRLEHDGHVGGIKEADGIAAAHTSLAGGFDGDFDAETLEVDDLLEH